MDESHEFRVTTAIAIAVAIAVIVDDIVRNLAFVNRYRMMEKHLYNSFIRVIRDSEEKCHTSR